MPEGKLVDKWYWRREDDVMIEIPVRLVKRTDRGDADSRGMRRGPPYEIVRSHLVVRMEEPVDINIESTDCEALRDAVFDALDERYSVKWERYYLVVIRLASPYEGLGAGFCLEYTDIEKGTTWDNKELLRRWRYRSFEVKPWPGKFKDERGRVQACIPATKANREGLKEFADRIHTLRAMLTEFLKPDVIEKNLANLAKAGLPSPDYKLIRDSNASRRRRND